jgi:hypothetical protein
MFYVNVYQYVKGAHTSLGLDINVYNDFAQKYADWKAMEKDYYSEAEKTTLKRITKDNYREKYNDYLNDFIQEQLFKLPNFTDDMALGIGLPALRPKKKKNRQIIILPPVVKIIPLKGMVYRVRCYQSTGERSMPDGASLLEIRYAITNVKPKDENEFTNVEFSTSNSFKLSIRAKDSEDIMYVIIRWVGKAKGFFCKPIPVGLY